MLATSKLTRKNQTTVPRAVRQALGLQPADEIVYEIEPDRVTLRARTGAGPGESVSLEARTLPDGREST